MAAELGRRMKEQGHRSLFLDFDPADGIPAGRDWERELYTQLRACRALLVLCSEHSMSSRWCFAEITHAKSMGKPIFPLKIAPCEIDPVLTSRQVVDLEREGELAYERLWLGLKAAGLDPADSFGWDGTRPPYPGLLAFQEEDAAIFFGRDPEIQESLERLQRLRQFGGSHLLAVLGPSGSGKSSLVRAGVLPRLRRNPDRWLVVPPFRAHERPLQELAIALAEALSHCGQARRWTEIRDTLETAATSDPPNADVLTNLALELQVTSGHRDATVMLALDQTEELLGPSQPGDASRFLHLLRAAIDAPGSQLLLMCTLRSDFLGQFQQHSAIRDFAFEDLRVGPMSMDRLAEVIGGPARLAGIDLEPGLIEAMIEDTETDDALPLLAYTLRELYERFGGDRRLQIEEYRERLGGLAGSVASAADAVIAAAAPFDERELQRAFLSMVRLDDDGHYARHPVRWTDLPASLHAVLDRFVQARLLTSGGDGDEPVLEVAHEALLRSWGRLRTWLDENREFLLWQQRMRGALTEWERSQRDPGALLRGGRLSECERWLDRADELPEDIRAYVEASRRQNAEDSAYEDRRRRRTMAALGGGLGAAVLLAIFAVTQWWHADQERRVADAQSRIALARQLGAQSQLLAEATRSELVQRALLAAESLKRLPTLQGFMTWSEIKAIMPQLLVDVEHEREILAIAWSPDASLFTTAGKDGTARVWQAATGEPMLSLDHEREVGAIAFSPDGRLLATAEEDGVARLWDAAKGTEVARMEQQSGKAFVSFSPDGTRLATVAETGNVGPSIRSVYHLWDTATGKLMVSMEHPGSKAWPRRLIFNPTGSRVATAGPDNTVRIWDVDTGDEVMSLSHPYGIYSIDFSPDGRRLATGASSEGEIRVWDLETGTEILQMKHGTAIFDLKFSPDGKMLATGGNGSWGGAIVWDAASGKEITRMKTVNRTRRLQFSPDGSLLATTSIGVLVSPANARVWEATTGREVARLGPEVAATSMAFNPDSSRLATAGDDHLARIWSLGGQLEHARLPHSGTVWAAEFSPDGQRIVTIAGHSVRLMDPETGTFTAELTYFTGNAGGVVESADVSPDSRRVAASYSNGAVVVWDLDTREKIAVMSHKRTARHVAFSPDGRLLASASVDQTARIWDAASAQELARLVHDDEVRSVAFSPDGKRLATASADATVRVWNVETGQQVLKLNHEGPVWDVEFTPDGTQLMTLSDDDSEARFWNAQTGRRGRTLKHKDFIYAAVFSPDGEWVATASRDNTAAIWNLPTGEARFRLVHEGPVTGVAYSDDGRWLATWSAWEETARVWEAATGHEVARVRHDAPVESAAFSPDGRWLVTGSEDKTARLWKWRPEDIVAEICSRLTRNLTEDEWSRFVGDEPYRPTCPGIAE